MEKKLKSICYEVIPLSRLTLLASLGNTGAAAFLGNPPQYQLTFKLTGQNFLLFHRSWKRTLRRAGKLPAVLIALSKSHILSAQGRIFRQNDPVLREAWALIYEWCVSDKKDKGPIRKLRQSLQERQASHLWPASAQSANGCMLDAIEIILTDRKFHGPAVRNVCYCGVSNFTEKLAARYIRRLLLNWAATGQIPILDGSCRLPWYFHLPPGTWKILVIFSVALILTFIALLYLLLV